MRPRGTVRNRNVEAQWRRVMEDRLARGGLTDWRARDLAFGVAAWCVREAGTSWLPEQRMDRWLAHALRTTGRVEEAERLAPACPGPAVAPPTAPALCLLAREGVLRIRRGDAGRLDWRLDLHRLAASSAVCEMAVYRLLYVSLARLGDVWRDGGAESRGSLSLAGIPALARRIEGRRASTARVRRRVRALRRYIRDVLARFGWEHVPLNHLDLVA